MGWLVLCRSLGFYSANIRFCSHPHDAWAWSSNFGWVRFLFVSFSVDAEAYEWMPPRASSIGRRERIRGTIPGAYPRPVHSRRLLPVLPPLPSFLARRSTGEAGVAAVPHDGS